MTNRNRLITEKAGSWKLEVGERKTEDRRQRTEVGSWELQPEPTVSSGQIITQSDRFIQADCNPQPRPTISSGRTATYYTKHSEKYNTRFSSPLKERLRRNSKIAHLSLSTLLATGCNLSIQGSGTAAITIFSYQAVSGTPWKNINQHCSIPPPTGGYKKKGEMLMR